MLRILPHRAFVEPAVSIQRIDESGGKTTAMLRIDGMLCSLCSANIRGRLEAVDGVRSVNVDLDESNAAIIYEGDRVATNELIAAVETAVVLKPVRRLLARLGGRGA